MKASVLALLLAGAAMTAPPLAAETLDLGGAISNRTDLNFLVGVPYDIVENGTLRLTLGGDLTYAGILRNGAGNFSLTKLGGGNLTLTGTSNDYSGETLITAGVLSGGADNSFSALSRVRVTATLELGGFDQTVRGFYQSGLISNLSGGTATLTTNPLLSSSFSGSIVETVGNEIALVKIGVGQQDLIGSNSYSGGTTLGGGTLGFGHSLALGTGAVTVSVAGSILRSLGVGLTLDNDLVLTQDLTITGAGTSPTLTGVISGAGSLTKISSGSLTITNGANSYSGGTFLTGGSLLLGGDNVLGDLTKALVVGPASALGTTGISALLSNDIVANAQLTLLTPNLAALDLAGVSGAVGKNNSDHGVKATLTVGF